MAVSPLLVLLLACTDPHKGSESGAVGGSTTVADSDSTTLPDDSTTIGTTADADGDGYPAPDDCDDADGTTHPGAEDVPDDGLDQDCDGMDACVVDNWYPTYIYIHDDEELSTFANFCDEYDGVLGNFSVENVTAVDLTTFFCLCEIDPGDYVNGGVAINDNPNLTSLAGLEHITSLEGSWLIQSNPMLSDISALSRVTTVGDLQIFDSPITSLAAFSNVATWTGSTWFGDLLLTDLDGLQGMRSVPTLVVYGDTLTSLRGLENLEEAPTGLSIFAGGDGLYPSQLDSLDGLDSLRSTEWLYVANFEESFTTFGPLASLESAHLSSIRNHQLTSLSTPPSLVNLLGFSASGDSLVSVTATPPSGVVEGDLELMDSPLLTDLSGLKTLIEVEGDLTVTDNTSLTSLAGLMNVRSVGGSLTITGNTALARADAEALVYAIGIKNIGGYITVRDNGR